MIRIAASSVAFAFLSMPPRGKAAGRGSAKGCARPAKRLTAAEKRVAAAEKFASTIAQKQAAAAATREQEKRKRTELDGGDATELPPAAAPAPGQTEGLPESPQAKSARKPRKWNTDDAIDRIFTTKLSGYNQTHLQALQGKSSGHRWIQLSIGNE